MVVSDVGEDPVWYCTIADEVSGLYTVGVIFSGHSGQRFSFHIVHPRRLPPIGLYKIANQSSRHIAGSFQGQHEGYVPSRFGHFVGSMSLVLR